MRHPHKKHLDATLFALMCITSAYLVFATPAFADELLGDDVQACELDEPAFGEPSDLDDSSDPNELLTEVDPSMTPNATDTGDETGGEDEGALPAEDSPESDEPAIGVATDGDDGGEDAPEEEEPQVGFFEEDGKTYYRLASGELARWSNTIDERLYYFNGAGIMQTGWVTWNDGTKSFFAENSNYIPRGAAFTHWVTTGGKTYWFDPSNHRAVRYSQTLIGKDGELHPYYFNGAGAMQTGIVTWGDGTKSYFETNNKLRTHGAAVSGWVTANGSTYYMNPANNRAVRYSHTFEGTDGKQHFYYFNGAGIMQTGWVNWSDGTRSFFAENSNHIPTGAAFTRWVTTGGKTYWFDPSNYRAVRYSQNLIGRDGKQHSYYFNSDGSMKTGWATWSDKSRSFYDENGIAVSGWRADGANDYYIDPSSLRSIRGLHTLQGKQYFFNTVNTALVKLNWVNMGDGKAGWAASNGVLTASTVAKYDSQGVLRANKAGWLSANSNKYYINKDLSFALGWLNEGGRWYYLDPLYGGAMVHGTAMTIDGYRRVFNANGVCSKVGYQNPSKYYQVSIWNAGKSCSSGKFSYVSPSRISADASRQDCINAFVGRAYDYIGTPYVWDYACAPGVGVDCSGLVLQCLYAVGIDPGRYNPYDHYYTPGHDHYANDMWRDSHMQTLGLGSRRRGDLICYDGHIGIYIGNDKMIHAPHAGASVCVANIYSVGLQPKGVKRVFV